MMSASKDKDVAVSASRTLPNNNNDVNMTNRNFELSYSLEPCDQVSYDKILVIFYICNVIIFLCLSGAT